MRPYPVMDCQDPERIAPFWCGLLDLQVSHRDEGSSGTGGVVVVGSLRDGFLLGLQRVPEAKTVKNRMHLDVHVDDLDEGTRQVEALGGRWLEPGTTHDMAGGFSWRVMADPEGNEFCIHQLPQAVTEPS